LSRVSCSSERGERVGDDAGTGLHVRGAVLEDDGPDGDAGVEVAGEVDVADGARVGPAAGRLEVVDDLHRPDLRRAGHGARGEDRPQHVDGAEPSRSVPVTELTRCITWL
jgi:hypothetical protein